MIQINDYFEKCITSTNFKFFNNKSPLYMNVFVQAVHPNTNTRISFPKLCQPLRKTNQRQKKLSHVATNIWNSLPDSLKSTKGLNTYKNTGSKNISLWKLLLIDFTYFLIIIYCFYHYYYFIMLLSSLSSSLLLFQPILLLLILLILLILLLLKLISLLLLS